MTHDTEQRDTGDQAAPTPLPETFGEQWNLLVRLVQAVGMADVAVVRRGWHEEEDYRTLAARLLSVDDVGIPSPLLLPSTEDGWEAQRDNPGDLTDTADAELCAVVCRRTGGRMTCDHWETLNERQRIGWLRNALTEYSDVE